MSADAAIRAKVDADIATYNARLKEARDKWDSAMVTFGSWLGGTDGRAVRGAIETNARRAEKWKARGAALAGGNPLDLDDDPARTKLDSMALWTTFGNDLKDELEDAAELRRTAGFDNAITHTAKVTVETVGKGVADLAQTANEVGSSLFSWRKPILWGGLALLAIILLVNVGALSFLARVKRGVKELRR